MKRFVVLVCAVAFVACGPEEKPDNNVSPNNTSANNTGNNTAGNNTTGNNTPGNNTAGGNNTTGNNTTSNNTNNTTPPGEISYHANVRPLLEANCTQCHYEGGIAPFPLTTYEEVAPLSGIIMSAVESELMPPWPPADGCGDFKYERTLDEAEKQVLRDWIANDKPEGNPDDYNPPQMDAPDLGPVDWTADIGVEYTPNPPEGGIDDYRCFIIEHDFTEDQFMNAFQVRPGDISTVHHVLFWQIDGGELATARGKESAPGEGYTCFGSAGVGDETGLIGGWVPGALPLQFGEGQGMRIPSDSFIVVQIHYNTINGSSPDRTEIDMWFTDGPATTPLGMYPLPDTDLFVAAGDANGVAGNSVTLPALIDNIGGIDVYGVVPHMHTLGTSIKVSADDRCLIDVPDWDFNWQGFYLFKEKINLSGGTTLNLECRYDNSMENQPMGRTPQDVRWGEGTYDEMCLNYFITEEIPFL